MIAYWFFMNLFSLSFWMMLIRQSLTLLLLKILMKSGNVIFKSVLSFSCFVRESRAVRILRANSEFGRVQDWQVAWLSQWLKALPNHHRPMTETDPLRIRCSSSVWCLSTLLCRELCAWRSTLTDPWTWWRFSQACFHRTSCAQSTPC